ncbi:MAG: translation initiation factor IF-2 [Candidatus Saccharimonadales bacterium]
MDKTVAISTPITVSELATAIGVEPATVVGELMKSGILAQLNDTLDFETAEIVASELGVELSEDSSDTAPSKREPAGPQLSVLEAGVGEPRPPVIAVMGHVDHGKTTLLDGLRNSNVAAGEAGGITQHISAYQTVHNDRTLTFLDTPGHEAFSILREHGARLTDVAIIVIAADDGIKPQTEEAIRYAQEAGVRIVVAVNKIDKPEADPARIRQQLADKNLIPEEWGGETVVVDISAERKQNLDKLLDMVILVADMEDLRARGKGPMEGTVIEAQMITGKGAVATVLVQHGQLDIGDFIVAGDVYGKVRSLEDYTGTRIKRATPSQPVAVSGWKTPPHLGAFVYEVSDEKAARTAADAASSSLASTSSITQADAMTAAMTAGQASTIPILLKADVDGSLSSVRQSIELLKTAEVRPEIVSTGVGPISESDVTLAESSGARILGFNVSVPNRIKQLALQAGVEIKLYSVIYELLDDLREDLTALLAPEIIEEEMGALKVKGVFKTAQKETICGGEVTRGKLTPDLLVRIADGEEIGTVSALQREQQAAKEIVQGEMCGVSIATRQKVKLAEGDVLEFFTRTSHQRSL